MIGCLMIHGYTGGPKEIEPLLQYLKKHTDWRIEVPVLTGHGEILELDEVTYDVWLKDAENAYLRLKEECDTVYLIGFSMGGMIAAYLAAHHDVEKLVLLAPARKYLSFKYLRPYIRQMIRDRFKGKLEENKVYLHYKNKIETVPFKANVEFMKLVNETKKHLDEITTPVFIAQGKKDGLVPYETVYALDKEIGSHDKEVVIFEESNHMICLGDDSEVLNRLVLEFLTEEFEESDKNEKSAEN